MYNHDDLYPQRLKRENPRHFQSPLLPELRPRPRDGFLRPRRWWNFWRRSWPLVAFFTLAGASLTALAIAIYIHNQVR